jgi:hypothetical protein
LLSSILYPLPNNENMRMRSIHMHLFADYIDDDDDYYEDDHYEDDGMHAPVLHYQLLIFDTPL